MRVAGRITDTIIDSHRMTVESRLCSRFRTPKSDCSICSDLCPVNAIVISEKGAEIQAVCTDCGVCISACPNGAFRINGRDDKKIIEEIGSRVKGQGSRVFRISCEHGDETSDLILSCLSRLTEVLLLEPVKMGVSTIEILQPLCKECPSKKAAPHINRVVQQTRYIYEMLGIKEDCISVSSVEFRENKNSELRTQNSELRTISRRQFFGSIKNKAIEVAAAAVPDNGNGNGDNGKHELFREVIQNKSENTKRSMLLESIKDIGTGGKEQQKTSNSGLRTIHKVEVSSENCIVAEIEINSKCTACGVCATLCPTGAITQQWTENHYSLRSKPALCTNCNVCVYACMPGAIRIKERVSLNLLMEDTEVRLFEATKKRCVVCRMDFIGGESEICPLCINIHNKQMAAIQNLFKKGG